MSHAEGFLSAAKDFRLYTSIREWQRAIVQIVPKVEVYILQNSSPYGKTSSVPVMPVAPFSENL